MVDRRNRGNLLPIFEVGLGIFVVGSLEGDMCRIVS